MGLAWLCLTARGHYSHGDPMSDVPRYQLADLLSWPVGNDNEEFVKADTYDALCAERNRLADVCLGNENTIASLAREVADLTKRKGYWEKDASINALRMKELERQLAEAQQ